MAEQPWQVEVGDWASIRELQGWRLRVEVIVEGLRLTVRPSSGSPAVWIAAGHATCDGPRRQVSFRLALGSGTYFAVGLLTLIFVLAIADSTIW